jgi:hypothetical protein
MSEGSTWVDQVNTLIKLVVIMILKLDLRVNQRQGSVHGLEWSIQLTQFFLKNIHGNLILTNFFSKNSIGF